MTPEKDFERRLTTWLADAAPDREPEGLLPRALVHAQRSRIQPAWIVDLRGTGMGRRAAPTRLIVALLLSALLATALLGGALIGSGGRLLSGPPPSPLPTWPSALAQVSGLPGRFAFSSDRDGDFDIYTMRPDRTSLVQLTDGPGDDVSPLWSPDGGRIAFSSNRDGDAGIYIINADGTHETLVVNGPGDESLGAWSPDGKRIAYADAANTIHTINVDGTDDREVRLLTGPPNAYGSAVSGWMPRGDELLIVFDKSPEGGDLDVYRLRIADGGVIPLTTSDRDDGTPAVSPDGSKIAFQSDRNGGCLFVMDVDGSNVARLTTGCSKGFAKAWAPDGTMIGWAGARRSDFDQPRDIQVIRADGSGRTRLTDSNDIFDLAWGPSP